MSFALGMHRKRVAFNVPDGVVREFDLAPYRCLLDIRSNIYFRMGHAMIQDARTGNFSTWVAVGAGEAIAVSGLASCGAIVVANHDFSRMAAGHMSGDVQFVQEWCDRLGHSDAGPPHYLVWATGPDSRGRRRGTELLKYMEHLHISPNRAPAVKSCSAIVVSGDGKAHAAYGDEITKLMTQ